MKVRTWDKIEIPDPNVLAVRDKTGCLWRRKSSDEWVCVAMGDPDPWGAHSWRDRSTASWMDVLTYAPLRETSEAAERFEKVGPIEITQAAVDAVAKVHICDDHYHCDRCAESVIRVALEALGFQIDPAGVA